MTILAGDRQLPILHLDPSHLAFGPGGAGYPLAIRSSQQTGVHGHTAGALPEPSVRRAGVMAEKFGGVCLFERVLIVPRQVNAGPVLSPLVFTVDIWNTFREVEQVLTGLVESGPGSAIVILPAVPLPFAPLGFLAQAVTLPTVGDAVIAESIDFVFPGIEGTVLTITGNRLALFSIEANWDDGFDEKPQIWMTDVLKATKAKEQRLGLRTMPRTQVKFRITPDRLSKAILEGLLWGWQNQVYGIPFWPDAHPLLANVGSGATVLLVDTTNRSFTPGGLMTIWRDSSTYEVQEIVGLVSGGVQLSPTGTNSAWSGDGRTLCVPVRRGRLANSQDVKRTTSRVAQVEVTFDCEVV